MNKVLLLLLTGITWGLHSSAQGLLGEQIFDSTSTKASVTLISENWVNSNGLSASFWFATFSGGELSRDIRQKMVDRTGKLNRQGQESLNGIAFQFKLNNKLSITTRVLDRQVNAASISDDGLKLAFFGNKQFAGKTADLSPFAIQVLRFQQYQVETRYQHQNWNFKAGLSFLNGEQFYNMKPETASLYTHDTGEFLVLNLKTKAQRSDTTNSSFFAHNGWGIGLNIGVSKQASLKLFGKQSIGYWEFGISDIGQIKWYAESVHYEVDTNYLYEGTEIYNIFNTDGLKSLTPDSIYDELTQNAAKKEHYTTLSPLLQFQLFQENEKWIYHAYARVRLNGIEYPYAQATAIKKIKSKWAVGPLIGIGGYSLWNAGFDLRYFTKSFDIGISSQHLQSFLLPTHSGGLHLRAQLNYKF